MWNRLTLIACVDMLTSRVMFMSPYRSTSSTEKIVGIRYRDEHIGTHPHPSGGGHTAQAKGQTAAMETLHHQGTHVNEDADGDQNGNQSGEKNSPTMNERWTTPTTQREPDDGSTYPSSNDEYYHGTSLREGSRGASHRKIESPRQPVK